MKLGKTLNFKSSSHTIDHADAAQIVSVARLSVENTDAKESEIIRVLGNSGAGISDEINKGTASHIVINCEKRRSVGIRKIVVDGVDKEFHNYLNITAIMLSLIFGYFERFGRLTAP